MDFKIRWESGEKKALVLGELSPESWTVKKVPKIAIAIFGIIFYTNKQQERTDNETS